MARKMKTAGQAADRYQKGVTNAGPDYTTGVQNAGSWVEGAIAAAPRRNAGLQRAISSGSIDAGIQRTGDAQWRQKTLAKGVNNYTASVQSARPKYEAGMNKAMQFQQNAQAATANIDTSTPQGRLNKMMAWVQSVSDQAQAAKAGK